MDRNVSSTSFFTVLKHEWIEMNCLLRAKLKYVCDQLLYLLVRCLILLYYCEVSKFPITIASSNHVCGY